MRVRLKILYKYLVVDWNVLHGHKPFEIVSVILAIFGSQAENDCVVVEAGCWYGGSSAKISLACEYMGYKLLIYDSFEGVEYASPDYEESIYFGQYVASEKIVIENIAKYGSVRACEIKKGWFEQTFKNFDRQVIVAYIDCDLAKGTLEVLQGIKDNLLLGYRIFTQDYHISSVRRALADVNYLKNFGLDRVPKVKLLARNLAELIL
ncbi:MAG: hypothetical protein JST14_07130 [Bacteroidetes bacterium]|nr:hypothetical protein [Bacteroidota bacterium]